MQFESLKVFCDIARHRSFSQAAAANNVTQSAASQIVLQLEKRMGVQLIDRSTRPLQLTPPGKVYYEGCKPLVEQYLELEASVLAGSPRHALAQTLAVRPTQLAGEKFIGFDRDLVIRREVDRFLRGAGVTVEMVHEFDNIENIKKAIEISAGIALLPAPTLR